MRKTPIAETLLDLLFSDLVDDRERFLGDNNELWLPLGADHHRNQATNWTAEKYHTARTISRQLCEENCFAINGLENRINYVIGTGHQYLVGPKRGHNPSDELLREVDAFLEEFRANNHWHSRQIETMRRVDRDGTALIRMFDDNGMTQLRYIEPEELQQPSGENPHIRCGIEFIPGDAETPLAYLTENERIPAEVIQRRNSNVDLNAPLGIPLYHPVHRNLKRAALILRNMSVVVEIQSAIAFIRKHKGTSIAQLQAARSAAADATVTNPATGRTNYLQQYPPGSIIDAHGGVEYEFPTKDINADGGVNVLKAELRGIAARLVMPEFMFTSDASNAAYASTLVSEGPIAKMFERLQKTFIHDDLSLLRHAITNAVNAGILPMEAITTVQLTAKAPTVQSRDFLKQAHANAIAHKAGILSPQTWSQQLQLDYDREQANIQSATKFAHAAQSAAAFITTPRPPDDNTHGSRFPSDDNPQPDS